MKKITLILLAGILFNSFSNAKTNTVYGGGDDWWNIKTTQAGCPTITITPTITNVTCNGYANGTASVSASGGASPYTYLWSPGGQTSTSVSKLSPGTYTVTVTDYNSCTGTYTFTITQPAVLGATTSTTPSSTICSGTSATISANVTGGTAPYTYSWTQGGTTSNITVSPSTTTIYSVSVTDANSCAANGAQNITVNQTPTVVATASVSTICPGGSSPISASGASNYTWTPLAGLTVTTGNYINASPTVTTTYTVTGSTTVGCTSTATVMVTVNASPTIVVTPGTPSICTGGQATLNASGATNYTWSPTTNLNTPSGGTVVASPTATITYTVNGSGSNGCTSTTPVTVTVNPNPPTPTLGSNGPICSGAALNLTATSSGATKYTWAGPNSFTSATQNPTIATTPAAAAGTYSVTASTPAGCSSPVGTLSVVVYATPTVVITSSNPSICPGGNSSLTATGASSYVWTAATSLSNISMGYATATPTATTTYSVTGTSANGGCTAIGTTTVKVEVLSINMNTVNESCNGSTNGNITAVVSNGTNPYKYTWSNAATTQLIYNLPTGTYSVLVKDSIGCKDSATATITQPAALTVTASATNTSCGRTNGTVTATPNGGVAPFNYSWTTTPAETGSSINGLNAGTYSVTLTDKSGCTATGKATVGASNTPLITPTITNSSCGLTNGKAKVVISGGTPPYRYSWNNGDTLSTDSNMAAATYVITVTDAAGCLTFEPININDASGPTLTTSLLTNVSCGGGANGAITVNATGGAGGYKYKWSNGATTASITGLTAAPYLITVTDVSGCLAVNTINVNEPTAMSLSVSPTAASCGSANGGAGVTVSGGTSPYTYLWSTGSTNYYTVGVTAGTYSITVTDNNGCQSTSEASVNNTSGPMVTIDSVIDMNCATKTMGKILITAAGGTPPYTYLWSNSATTQNVSGLGAGNYAVTVTDASGCKGDNNATIATALPPGMPICMVTVNPITSYNTITWDSVNPNRISEYLIYRQTTTPGVYTVIGHSAGSAGSYVDTLSNSGKRSWWYELSELDSCGQASPIGESVLFKTIHLTATLTTTNKVSLVWDNFEGATFQRYIIYRDSVPGIVKDSIGSVDTNTFGYIDTPPTTKSTWYYHIGIGGTFGCSLTAIMPHQVDAINYNAAKSNTGNVIIKNTTGIPTVSSVNSLTVYPNPTRGLFTMSLNLDKQQNVKVTIYDELGKAIEEDNYGAQNGKMLKQYDLSSFSKGIYTVQVITGDGVTYRKVVIQ